MIVSVLPLRELCLKNKINQSAVSQSGSIFPCLPLVWHTVNGVRVLPSWTIIIRVFSLFFFSSLVCVFVLVVGCWNSVSHERLRALSQQILYLCVPDHPPAPTPSSSPSFFFLFFSGACLCAYECGLVQLNEDKGKHH